MKARQVPVLAVAMAAAWIAAGCAAPANQNPVGPAELAPVNQRDATEEEVALILEELKYDAKDASSVQVRNVKVAQSGLPGGSHVCGEFNGKNSYGAYVGFEPFWAYLSEKDGRKKVDLFAVGSKNGETRKTCRRHGMIPSR